MLHGSARPESRPAHVVGGHPVDGLLETVPEALEAARPDVFLLVGHRLLLSQPRGAIPGPRMRLGLLRGDGRDADALMRVSTAGARGRGLQTPCRWCSWLSPSSRSRSVRLFQVLRLPVTYGRRRRA